MTEFTYKMMERSGRVVTGSISAATVSEATRSLVGSGHTVLELTETGSSQQSAPGDPASSRFGFGKRLDQAQLFADLGLLTGAGLTLSKALATLARAGSTAAQATIAATVLDAISTGSPASIAFRQVQGISDASLALIMSGENSGNLHNVFSSIAKQLNQQTKVRSAVINSLAYPLFLIALMVLAFAIVTFVLVPAIEPAFENTGKESPLPIRFFSAIREASTLGIPLIIMASAGLGLASVSRRTRGYLSRAWTMIILKAPMIGKHLQDQQLAQYLSSLSMLLENGVVLSRSLELANAAATLPSLREKLDAARKLVTSGTSLPDALKQQSIFDDRILSVLSVGFEAGKMATAAGYGANMLEERAKKKMELFLAILTPAITIFIGIAIGGLILSVMSALLSVNEIAVQ